jgi:hypothetical protein
MSAPTLQQVLASHRHTPANRYTGRILQQLQQCRTPACGYHVYDCSNEDCSKPRQYRYNSCRNRHCPQCGGLQKQEWIEKRISELLPVKYFHVVFTLPHQLNPLVMGNRAPLFQLLQDSSWYTLHAFSKDPRHLGATPGVISILHTWGQNLSFHPHVHCIVSGGGINASHQWKEAKKVKHHFLFNAIAMMQVYRGRFLSQLQQLKTSRLIQWPGDDSGWKQLLQQLAAIDWVVYAKSPFGGPSQVVEYLGRYTHKVAISNNRIKDISTEGIVLFSYKDYADGNTQKDMELPAQEFIRRFEQHILPKGFTRIRHYGYLSNRGRSTRIAAILKQLKLPPPKPVITYDYATAMLVRHGVDVHQCKHCIVGTLSLVITIARTGVKTQPIPGQKE